MPQYAVGDETMFFLNETRYDEFVSGGGGGTGDVTTQDLEDAIAAHSGDTTNVHGISNTAFIKGVAVDTDGGVVTRPDFLSVEFVQANDPAAIAAEGDTFTPTEEA